MNSDTALLNPNPNDAGSPLKFILNGALSLFQTSALAPFPAPAPASEAVNTGCGFSLKLKLRFLFQSRVFTSKP